MRKSLKVFAIVWGIAISNIAAAQTADEVRSTLAGAVGGSLCVGLYSRWCAALGVGAAYWINKQVSLAIDRQFAEKDQRFANSYKVTICYNNGRCIHPK
ncbi:MAG: hypothetical protein ABL907_03490 [Hyphomicrobium sp.]